MIHENWPNDLIPVLVDFDPLRCSEFVRWYCYARQFKDMTLEESAPLVGYLNRWTTGNDFTCRVRWEPGTLTIWDNRAVIHDVPSDDFAVRLDGSGFRRVVQRVTVSA